MANRYLMEQKSIEKRMNERTSDRKKSFGFSEFKLSKSFEAAGLDAIVVAYTQFSTESDDDDEREEKKNMHFRNGRFVCHSLNFYVIHQMK